MALRSVITVRDANGRLVSRSTSDGFGVGWQAPGKFRHVEYMVLQEIDMPIDLMCRDYVLDVKHEAIPASLVLEGSDPPALYARKSRRL